MEILPVITKIDGDEYEAHPATVTNYRFEIEDHGMLTFFIQCDLATGGSQGFGGYCMDRPNGDWRDQSTRSARPWSSVKDRQADRFAGEVLLCLVKLLGTPGKTGQTVLALKEPGSGWNGTIVGLATLKGEYFLPKILADTITQDEVMA